MAGIEKKKPLKEEGGKKTAEIMWCVLSGARPRRKKTGLTTCK